MTNPDREELVKPRKHYFVPSDDDFDTCARCGNHIRSDVHCSNKERPETDAEYIDRLESALRRLASSDGGVKGEPVPVAWPRPASLHWLGDREDANKSRHAADMRGCVMYFDRQSDCLQFMRLIEVGTAPPAAAGMREALKFAHSTMESLRVALRDDPAVHGREWIPHGIALNSAIRKADNALADAALTAPGATTKSDGGGEDAPTDAQRQEALRLLSAEDGRQSKLHDLLETIREQIRTGIEPEHRPEGLFKNIQDAVYAMRGRTPLMNDAAITCALYTDQSDGFKRGLDAAACWHESEARHAKAIYCEMDRYSEDHEERASWRSHKDKEDRHLYCARVIRTVAGPSDPDWEQDQAETTRIKPSSTRSEVTALADIAEERRRQRDVKGWTVEHDDGHATGEMAGAAACYALSTIKHWAKDHVIKLIWPWASEWWKPKDHRRNLVKAGALIVAEIERLDRLDQFEIGRK
ncbi:MAG: hypothetical protein M9932_04355 [Xanthobacteraceae bacterium]|nr:hypothetical protein [Xanthobacteraceae bacterium]